MQLFHEITDAQAIVRGKGRVFKQSKVYSRAGKLYIAALGGYVKICAKLGNDWVTSNPNLTVIDISQDIPGLSVDGEPRFIKPESGCT